MVIEAAKGGHTHVVQLLIDFPNSILVTPPPPPQLSEVAGAPAALETHGSVIVPVSESNRQMSPTGNARSVPPPTEGQSSRIRAGESLSSFREVDSEDNEDDEDVDDDEEVPGLHGELLVRKNYSAFAGYVDCSHPVSLVTCAVHER